MWPTRREVAIFFQMLITYNRFYKKTPALLVPVYERISFHICILGVFWGYVQGIF